MTEVMQRKQQDDAIAHAADDAAGTGPLPLPLPGIVEQFGVDEAQKGSGDEEAFREGGVRGWLNVLGAFVRVTALPLPCLAVEEVTDAGLPLCCPNQLIITGTFGRELFDDLTSLGSQADPFAGYPRWEWVSFSYRQPVCKRAHRPFDENAVSESIKVSSVNSHHGGILLTNRFADTAYYQTHQYSSMSPSAIAWL